MGGLGSGRWSGSRSSCCEDYISLDLADLKRRGLLDGNYQATVFTWSYYGEVKSSLGVIFEPKSIRLMYKIGDKDFDSRVYFSYTDTNFGGKRRWFSCPWCGRSCRVIYAGEYFKCRRCLGLRYESQYETVTSRQLSKADKIRKILLNGRPDDGEFPDKPKGMHWSTYNRLVNEYEYYFALWADQILGWSQRLNNR